MNLDETAVRIVPAGERGWSKRAEPAHVFASRAFVTVTLAANMRGGMWTQIVYEGKTDRVHPSWTTLSAPARDAFSNALDHARGSLGHDRRD